MKGFYKSFIQVLGIYACPPGFAKHFPLRGDALEWRRQAGEVAITASRDDEDKFQLATSGQLDGLQFGPIVE